MKYVAFNTSPGPRYVPQKSRTRKMRDTERHAKVVLSADHRVLLVQAEIKAGAVPPPPPRPEQSKADEHGSLQRGDGRRQERSGPASPRNRDARRGG